MDTSGSRQVDAGENQDQATDQDDDVISPQASKDDSTPGLPTPAKTPEPQLDTTNVELLSALIKRKP